MTLALQEPRYHSFGRYEVSPGKFKTYTVKADNGEFRHYLARLLRSSGYFACCTDELSYDVCLYVYCCIHCQLKNHQFAAYSLHL